MLWSAEARDTPARRAARSQQRRDLDQDVLQVPGWGALGVVALPDALPVVRSARPGRPGTMGPVWARLLTDDRCPHRDGDNASEHARPEVNNLGAAVLSGHQYHCVLVVSAEDGDDHPGPSRPRRPAGSDSPGAPGHGPQPGPRGTRPTTRGRSAGRCRRCAGQRGGRAASSGNPWSSGTSLPFTVDTTKWLMPLMGLWLFCLL